MTRSTEIAKAREIDTKIAEAWAEYHAALAPIAALQREIKDSTKRFKSHLKYNADYATTKDGIWYTGKIEKAEAQIKAIYEAAHPLAEAARQMDKDLYTGWQRFFLVEHIHSSQACSSFRPTTSVGWLPKVSGLTEAEAVAEYGAILCTICFPSAPVEMTNGSLKDPNVCEGAGKSINWDLPNRKGYFSGNWATCECCGKRIGISNSAFRIPKHKPEAK